MKYRQLVALALLLVGCSDSNTPVHSKQGWEIRYSTGVSLNTPVSGEEFSFNFPLAPGSVHYITKPAKMAATGAVTATFTIMTTGDPTFDYHTAPNNTCDAPAAVRLFLQQQGDDISGVGQYEFYRWFSNAGTDLKKGSFTIVVPLEPALWTSVFGKKGDANPAAFAAAISDLGNVGVTFGGGCFYGHGVRILNGSAVFTMNHFSVQ